MKYLHEYDFDFFSFFFFLKKETNEMSIFPAIRMFSQFFICQNGYSFTIFRCVRRSRWSSNQRGPLKQKIRDEVCPNSLLQIKVHRGILFFERIISYSMINDIDLYDKIYN